MHDLILRNRVAGYREGGLHARLHSAARPGFEHYLPGPTSILMAYALPGLAGTHIVGHVDPKADRSAGRLHVVSRSIRRGHKVAPAVAGLARFLGLESSHVRLHPITPG